MPLKKSAGSVLNPGNLMTTNSQSGTCANAAAKYGVSARTLWGVYGTESNYGQDAGTSSAGAQGPMQFEPSTWARYGGGQSINSYAAAMDAAAHYLHDLGADSDPRSANTIRALNAYNGNGGGTSITTYVTSVWNKGQSFSGTTSQDTPVSPANTGSSDSGLTNILGNNIGSIGGSGGLLGNVIVSAVKDLAPVAGSLLAVAFGDLLKGVGDFVIIPIWHWNQRGVDAYWTDILTVNPTRSQYPYAWPWTAAFWGLGYVLLFTDPDTGKLTPAPPHRSRFARHVGRAQSIPARRSLVKPKDVKERTPPKPPEVQSRTRVTQTGTLRATRTRTVKVENVHGNTAVPNAPLKQTVRSETRVSRVPVQAQGVATAAKPNAADRTGSTPRTGSGDVPPGIAAPSRGHGRQPRHGGTPPRSRRQ